MYEVYSICRVCVRVKVIHGRMHDEGTEEKTQVVGGTAGGAEAERGGRGGRRIRLSLEK